MSLISCTLSALLGYHFACMKEGMYGTKKIFIKTNEFAFELLDGNNSIDIETSPHIQQKLFYNKATFVRSFSKDKFVWFSIKPFEVIFK